MSKKEPVVRPRMIRFTEAQEVGLKALASEAGSSVSTIIRDAVSEFLDSFRSVQDKRAELEEKGQPDS